MKILVRHQEGIRVSERISEGLRIVSSTSTFVVILMSGNFIALT
jgi:hypothetical protein